jgi:glycosyltransferase involved in cell wall biosynthesis
VNKISTAEVSAVICTMNSISGIRECLASLRLSGVGQIIVVDADSTDGTREIAEELSDLVLSDTGQGLGNARNLGIAATTGQLILNMGSDNVLPVGELQKMIDYLQRGSFKGVSAQTRVAGENYVSWGLNVWRAARFSVGKRSVIGTPTLFEGDLLRANLYDPSRKYSDDSELCERWTQQFGAQFAISDAVCLELGKSTWDEVKIRAKMYGVSDHEVYTQGVAKGWSSARKLKSVTHPLFADLITPVRKSTLKEALGSLPFLVIFTWYRYLGWVEHTKMPVRTP